MTPRRGRIAIGLLNQREAVIHQGPGPVGGKGDHLGQIHPALREIGPTGNDREAAVEIPLQAGRQGGLPGTVIGIVRQDDAEDSLPQIQGGLHLPIHELVPMGMRAAEDDGPVGSVQGFLAQMPDMALRIGRIQFTLKGIVADEIANGGEEPHEGIEGGGIAKLIVTDENLFFGFLEKGTGIHGDNIRKNLLESE